MKRKVLLILFITALAAMASAQGWGWDHHRVPPAETVTVSGRMIVARGFPALESGGTTYMVAGINRLIGFVDGLKEGAQVTIEGLATTVSQDGKTKFLRPSKLTLDGRSYDLAMPAPDLDRIRDRLYRGELHPPQMPPRQAPRHPRTPAPPMYRHHRYL
jgi:hypothetical protein